ncbi:hypothetical protein BpHYR1_021467, partial [Brachionus plicatilis]
KDTKGQQRIFSYKNTLIVNSSDRYNKINIFYSTFDLMEKAEFPLIQIKLGSLLICCKVNILLFNLFNLICCFAYKGAGPGNIITKNKKIE